jgi:hypothetical protein
MGGACSTHEGEDKYIQSSGWKGRTQETTKKTKYMWKDNIKVDREIEWNGLDKIDLAQDGC